MATAYWFYGGVTQDLSDPTNWWDDAGHTTPFSGVIPGGSDSVIILGSTMPTSNTTITLLKSWDSSGAATGTSIPSNVTSPIAFQSSPVTVTMGVAGDATSSHVWSGNFSNSNDNTVVLQGGATFYPTVTADKVGAITFKDSASWVAGSATITLTVLTSCTFQNSAAFNSALDTLFCPGSTTITVTFSNSASLTAGLIVNNGTMTLTFNDTATPAGGTITDGSNALTVVLNNSVSNTGTTLTGNASNYTLNNAASHAGPTVSFAGGTTTFNGTSTITSGSIACGTLVLNSNRAVNGGTITCSGNITGAQVGGIIPSANDVRSGTATGTTTGNMTLPATTDVKTGVQYGTSGTQYTGSFLGSGGGGIVIGG